MAVKIILIAGAVICALAIFIAAIKTKKVIRTLLLSAVMGIVALVAVTLSGNFTGVSLAINPWTVLCSATAGIPGVVLMLVIKMIWMI